MTQTDREYLADPDLAPEAIVDVRMEPPTPTNQAVDDWRALVRDVEVVYPDCSQQRYDQAYDKKGLERLSPMAVAYLARRKVAPEIAAKRAYRSGTGALPSIPEVLGRWTLAQHAWAQGEGGREWLLIPWVEDVQGRIVVGYQLRWLGGPRIEVLEEDDKGRPTKVAKHKFDFPAGRSSTRMSRLVDAMHSKPGAPIVKAVESPVRADCLASIAPSLPISIGAVGGITMAYEGASSKDNPNDFKPRLSKDVVDALGGVGGKVALWCPDSDHSTNPACNSASQRTVESMLDLGATWVGVIDIKDYVVHKRSGRVHPLGEGVGVDDYAAAMSEYDPSVQWLGPLLAEAIEATDYIAMYPDFKNDVQGLSEVVAADLARTGLFKAMKVSKSDVMMYHYEHGYWGVDLAESATSVRATGCANRWLGFSKDDTASGRVRARTHIDRAVKGCVKTNVGRTHILVREAAWEPREYAEYLPTPSGLLTPQRLTLAPHTPAAMNLGVTTVEWKPGARDAVVDEFFDAFFTTQQRDENGEIVRGEDGKPMWVPDPEKRQMVQEIAGAGLLGKTYDTCLFMVGAGGAGMSTFMSAISGVLPSVYQGALSSADLTGKDNQFVLSGIYLARLTEINEFGHADRLNEKLFKNIVQDGSAMKVEAKYGDPFLSVPRSTCICTTQHMPGVSPVAGQNNSLRRRVCEAHFDRVVENPRSDLQDRLATVSAREAILAWMVEGAHRFLNRADRKPFRSEASLAAVEKWLTDYDRLGAFIEECMGERAGAYAEKGAAFERYERWCADNGIERGRMDKQRWTQAMEQRLGPSNANGNRRPTADGWKVGWKNWEIVSASDF